MRHFVAMAVVILLCTATANATNVWLSTSDTSSDVGVAMAMNLPNSSGQLHVWARPDAGENLANISLNVESSVDGVIAFTGATMVNPYLGNAGPLGGNKDVFRYEFANDSSSDPPLNIADPNRIEGLQGFTVSNGSVIGLGFGPGTTALPDPDYDAQNNSWRIGSVDYDAISGHTDIYLTIGENGINNAGGDSADTDVIFGDSDDTPLNGEDGRGQRSSRPDGSISVIPEPSSVVLALMGLLGLVFYGRRR
jgi:hypothetical protein